MSNIAGSSVYSSANTSTSTLRPRNNRLISYLEEYPSDNDVSTEAASTSTSTSHSPGTTPIRGRNTAQPIERLGRTQNRSTSENVGRRPSSLWDPWSSIQGVASSLLGGGENSTSMARKGSIKTPVWMKQDARFKTTTAISEWGPDGETKISHSGSIEDRQAIVQAKKREALLLSCTQEGKDKLGHIKRKASYDAAADMTSPGLDTSSDALVYKHKVQPQDTMAGVTIKFSCQPEAFRKVNRFWPNDNIQTRKHVLLPVDACSVRGRKLDDATSLELLTTQLNNVELDSSKRSISPRAQQFSSIDLSPMVATPKLISSNEEDYIHDSYVILPAFPEPVEILRIPRKSLGYFPRARRKSAHRAPDSMASTPKTSFDMLRHPPTHAAQQAAAALNTNLQQSLSSNPSSARSSRLSTSTRARSSSTTSTTTSNSNNGWILRGPGGVGTLRGLRSEVSRPGPAEDQLNQKFAHYFPSLVLQSDQEDAATGSNNRPPRSRTNTVSRSPYRSGPRASTDSIRSTRSNSSTFGAGVSGVESFVRKLATAGKRPDLPRSSSGNLLNPMGLPIGGETGLGDLIELETNPDAMHHGPNADRLERMELGNHDDTDDDATPTEIGRNQEDLLNERFPIRGRITRAYGGDDG
jgi:hypothetical protein